MKLFSFCQCGILFNPDHIDLNGGGIWLAKSLASVMCKKNESFRNGDLPIAMKEGQQGDEKAMRVYFLV